MPVLRGPCYFCGRFTHDSNVNLDSMGALYCPRCKDPAYRAETQYGSVHAFSTFATCVFLVAYIASWWLPPAVTLELFALPLAIISRIRSVKARERMTLEIARSVHES